MSVFRGIKAFLFRTGESNRVSEKYVYGNPQYQATFFFEIFLFVSLMALNFLVSESNYSYFNSSLMF